MTDSYSAPLWPWFLRHPSLFRGFDRLRDAWRNFAEKQRFKVRDLPATAGRVLVIRDRGLGDVLQITTLFDAIRSRFDANTLDMLTSELGVKILEHDPRIDRALLSTEPPEDLERQYDLFINLHIFDNSVAARRVVRSLPRERVLGRTYQPGADEEWLGYLSGGCWLRKYCRIADVPFDPGLPLRITIARDPQWDHDLDECCARHLPGVSADEPVVAVCLGGRDWIRNYSPAFIDALLTRLERDCRVVLFGLLSDRPPGQQQEVRQMLLRHSSVLDLLDRLDLRELLFVLQRASVVLSCDTGPVHLAIGVGTPLVALFGHTPGTQLLGPQLASDRHVILTPVHGCRGCGYRLRAECRGSRRAECMDRFEVDDVARAVMGFL